MLIKNTSIQLFPTILNIELLSFAADFSQRIKGN